MRGAMKAAVVLFSGLFLLMTSCELPAPWITVFSDDFNRADSLTVGNEWSTLAPSGSPPPSVSISGNALLMAGGDDSGPTPATVIRGVSLNGDFRFTFTFGFPGDASWVYLYVHDAAMHGYAMGFQPGSLGIWKDGLGLPGGVGLTLDSDHIFSIEIVREDAAITVVLTDTTTSGQWTATSTDDDYHDLSTMQFRCGFYSAAATSTRIDDFVLQTR